jgi:hypothetical protein
LPSISIRFDGSKLLECSNALIGDHRKTDDKKNGQENKRWPKSVTDPPE